MKIPPTTSQSVVDEEELDDVETDGVVVVGAVVVGATVDSTGFNAVVSLAVVSKVWTAGSVGEMRGTVPNVVVGAELFADEHAGIASTSAMALAK